MSKERGSEAGRRRGTRDGMLASRCWCERHKVLVTPADVRNGRTGSCGQLDPVTMRPVCTPAHMPQARS